MTRARRVALALGVPACLALTAWGAFAIVGEIGQGHFPVSATIPVSGGNVTAHFGGGSVLLQQGAAGQANLTGTAHYSLVRPTFTAQRAGDGVSFGYNCDLPVGNCGLDATVTVPDGTATAISTDGGNATVTGTTGDVTLSSGGGNVTADHAAGDLTLTTGGGNITIIVPRGTTQYNVNAGSAGGNVTDSLPIDTSSPHTITATTGGGDITLREAP
jgi:hypothetical protein